MSTMIPFNRVDFSGHEFDRIRSAVERGHISGDGHFTSLCQDQINALIGTKSCLLTTSCTHALEMSALLLDIGPGDEVILPSFTFVSTANAYALRGATLKFVDIRPDTLNFDERQVQEIASERTRAIVAVHYAGVACEMDNLLKTCEETGAHLIEDNAHGFFGQYNGRPLGSFGTFSTLSFHETKNISCGEGGALLINDDKYTERAEIFREKGTNRKQFFRGQVDKYTWVDLGSSYVQSELLAAALWAQLERREKIQQSRFRVWNHYRSTLRNWADLNDIGLPQIPDSCAHPAHLFYLLMPDEETRDRFLEHSKDHEILSVFHYIPLHSSPMGQKLGYREGQLPVTESVSRRLVRLPLFAGLTEVELQRITDMVLSFSA